MTRRTGVTRWLPMVAATALVGGCSFSGTSPGLARLTVRLTDAPFPTDSVARADVYIVRVEVRPASTDTAQADTAQADTTQADTTAADSSRGWMTVATPNTTYNLMDLQNGTTVDLGGTTLPTGSYDGVRLVLNTDSSSVTLKGGMVLSGNSKPGIMWPSAGQTGIKVLLSQPIAVTAGGTVMVVDFSLGSSFVMRGRTISQNGLLFKPVVHATAQAGATP